MTTSTARPPTPDLPPPAPDAPPATPRPRSWFWPGFLLAFLLLSFASCGGVALATGINTLDLRDLQVGNPAWTPPPIPPTPVMTPGPAPTAELVVDGLYRPGDRPRNITASQVNIRAVPGYLGKPHGDVIGQVPPGGSVEILGERAQADSLTWWRIRYTTPNGVRIEGWIAEATASGVQILSR